VLYSFCSNMNTNNEHCVHVQSLCKENKLRVGLLNDWITLKFHELLITIKFTTIGSGEKLLSSLEYKIRLPHLKRIRC